MKREGIYKGIEFEVELLKNAMINANGQKLYKITIEGESFNQRACNLDEATKAAKKDIENY